MSVLLTELQRIAVGAIVTVDLGTVLGVCVARVVSISPGRAVFGVRARKVDGEGWSRDITRVGGSAMLGLNADASEVA